MARNTESPDNGETVASAAAATHRAAVPPLVRTAAAKFFLVWHDSPYTARIALQNTLFGTSADSESAGITQALFRFLIVCDAATPDV